MSLSKKNIDNINLGLERVLPAACVAQIGTISSLQHPLSVMEKPVTEFKSQKRLREFIAGRNIAKNLIRKLTSSDALVHRSSTFLPIWPKGVTGSISHKGKLCGAIISNDSSIISLGFDIEKYEAIPEAIWSTYTDAEEIQKNTLDSIDKPYLANIIFSCKESAFKAFYQNGLTAVKLQDISIKLSPEVGKLKISADFKSYKAFGSVLIEEDIIVSWLKIDQ